MDTFECIATKLDVREFTKDDVSPDVKSKVLEAARLTGSGMNVQHWRLILVQERDRLRKLAQDSTSGRWVGDCNFAIIVLTDPQYGFHLIDAGRAVQDMQLAAWNSGVASGIFTGLDLENFRKDFGIPKEMDPSVIVGFGFPKRKITGRKKRNPLSEIAFVEKYGNQFEPGKLIKN